MSILNSKFIQYPAIKKPLLYLDHCFWNVLQHIVKSDRLYVSIKYWLMFRKRICWRNPQTFNEKLNWLKVYYRGDIMTRMADKIEAKIIVAEKIGSKYIVPLLGVWNKAEDVDFESLPRQFVLKCNHNSGGVCLYVKTNPLPMLKW